MTIYKIYKITNKLNGKIYIGQTRQPVEKRFMQHSKADSPLGQAMRQCGVENFTVEVIEYCDSQEQLNEREIFWISVLSSKIPNGYNVSEGGRGYIRTAPIEQKRAAEMTLADLAEALKRFRESRKWSQYEMARKMKVSRIMYRAYEAGKSAPSILVIVNFAESQNVPLDYLLGLSDNPAPVEKPADDAPVTRAEFEELKASIAQLKQK